jgi:hypothetical protein
MPLHLLQQQLGHARIDMTMRYARFHPDYGDVKTYFERVAEGLGLEGSTPQNTPHPSIERVDTNRIDVRKSLGEKAEGQGFAVEARSAETPFAAQLRKAP